MKKNLLLLLLVFFNLFVISQTSPNYCIHLEDTSLSRQVNPPTSPFFSSYFYTSRDFKFATKYFDYLGTGFAGDVNIMDHAVAGYTGSSGCSNFGGNIYFQGNVITKIYFSNFRIPDNQIQFDINYYDTSLANPFRINGTNPNFLPSGFFQQITKLTHGYHVRIAGHVVNFELHGYEAAIDNICMDSIGFNTQSINTINPNEIEFSIFPNPSKSSVSLKTSSINDKTTYSIRNALGQIVKRSKINFETTFIELNDLENGIYFVSILSDNKILKTLKMIKQ